MVSIRRMLPADISAIPRLDALAFTAYLRQKGHSGPVPMRTQANVLACLNLNPNGCFVAAVDEVIGFVFTRVLGTTGWIGTFGVHPDFQGQGVGWSLLAAAVECLQQAGCATIGLETMPDSPYNVGFYSRFGFLLTFPTVLLAKETGSVFTVSAYTVLSRLEKEEALSCVTQISQAACPGLDYAPQASNASEFEWGETLLIGWPQAWAFALVRTTPRGEGAVEPVAGVSALVIRSQATERLAEALQVVEAFAHSRGVAQVNLAVNTVDGDALQQALGYGFRVRRVVLRMVLQGKHAPPAGRVLSNWLM